MNRRQFLCRAGQAALAALGAQSLASAAGNPKPLNVVFFLADDMGWMDLSCYGSTYYETPNIDRLASEGMRFTQAYAACPVCSPTRASILTGKYPARLHLTDWLNGKKFPFAKLRVPDWAKGLAPEELTIGERLQAAGYATAAIGKWHLGTKPEMAPSAQGFDAEWSGELPRLGDPEADPKTVYEITKKAMAFLEANREKPFFLYVSHHAVHLPIEARQEMIAKYKAKPKTDPDRFRPEYAAMTEHLDEGVGAVLKKIDELGLRDNTLVIFMSDNGGYSWGKPDNYVTSNAPLRQGKGTLYEGGVREPLIVRWPGVVEAGSTSDAIVSSVDFYPTILEAMELEDAPEHRSDGVSFVSALRQSGSVEREAIYWHYPHYHMGKPGGAVRAGDWKLIEYYEDGAIELYNLKTDLSEAANLAETKPDIAARLRKMLADWRESVGAQMPTPNPDYDPARADKAAPKKTQAAEKEQ